MNKTKRNFLASVALATTTALIGLPSMAIAADTIKIGEINHYKRMAAFAAG